MQKNERLTYINNEDNDKKKFISLENIIRYFENGLNRKVFFNIELLIKKDIALSNKEIYLDLYVETKKDKKILLSKTLSFDEDKVKFLNSHEDPTVEINNSYCFAMTIERDDLSLKLKNYGIKEEEIIYIGGEAYIKERKQVNENTPQINKQRNIILSDKLENKEIPWSEIWSDHLFTRFVDDYKIQTSSDAILTFHMNDSNGIYNEETRKIYKNDIVDFYDYLKNNMYLGVQFSIISPYGQKELDIEEKYVVKGQKGIVRSDLLVVNNEIYYPNIVFHTKFLEKVDDKNFLEINNIQELIDLYINHKEMIRFFEMDFNYLVERYKESKTYSQSGIYSSNKRSRFFHIDQEICKNCDKNNICIQNIPSNLSEQVSKRIILIENKQECRLYKIFNDL